jgi:SAM-dependent methyltransferase
MLRKFLPANARVLEVGAAGGEFGALARNEFDYVGIDACTDSVRAARANAIEMYRATLTSFVNTGAAFDAITMFNVLEQLLDPHDALARAKDLLKPGGYLVVVTPDTESILSSLAGIHWAPHHRMANVILYSRSALIELLERSGFEIVYAHADFAYHDRDSVRRALEASGGRVVRLAARVVNVLPDPLRASGGSIRVVARRRTGAPVNLRAVPSMEATHAR